MTSQLKNMIKLGMRNPYFVEVRVEDQGIFALKSSDQSHISIREFDVHAEDFTTQVK